MISSSSIKIIYQDSFLYLQRMAPQFSKTVCYQYIFEVKNIKVILFCLFCPEENTGFFVHCRFFLFPLHRYLIYLFCNLLRFIIASIVLLINGLLLALKTFCLRGAVLFKISLHLIKNESRSF